MKKATDLEKVKVGEVILMKVCGCGDTRMIDGMVFERTDLPTSHPQTEYWKRIK